jgi:hypothetical protein
MARTVNARISPRLEQKLAEYCARRGVTRSDAVVRALDAYLDAAAQGVNAWSLAADLVPDEGAPALQSGNARALARKTLRGKAAR